MKLTPQHEAIFLEEEMIITRSLELFNEVDFLKQKVSIHFILRIFVNMNKTPVEEVRRPEERL